MPKTRKPAASQSPAPQVRKARRNSASTATPAKITSSPKPKAAEPSLPAAAVRQTKKGSILTLLQRPGGASIGDMTGATGWQTHSVRAALTGLRNEGRELVRAKNDAGVTHYRLATQA
jgi:hypothetical protein